MNTMEEYWLFHSPTLVSDADSDDSDENENMQNIPMSSLHLKPKKLFKRVNSNNDVSDFRKFFFQLQNPLVASTPKRNSPIIDNTINLSTIRKHRNSVVSQHFVNSFQRDRSLPKKKRNFVYQNNNSVRAVANSLNEANKIKKSKRTRSVTNSIDSSDGERCLDGIEPLNSPTFLKPSKTNENQTKRKIDVAEDEESIVSLPQQKHKSSDERSTKIHANFKSITPQVEDLATTLLSSLDVAVCIPEDVNNETEEISFHNEKNHTESVNIEKTACTIINSPTKDIKKSTGKNVDNSDKDRSRPNNNNDSPILKKTEAISFHNEKSHSESVNTDAIPVNSVQTPCTSISDTTKHFKKNTGNMVDNSTTGLSDKDRSRSNNKNSSTKRNFTKKSYELSDRELRSFTLLYSTLIKDSNTESDKENFVNLDSSSVQISEFKHPNEITAKTRSVRVSKNVCCFGCNGYSCHKLRRRSKSLEPLKDTTGNIENSKNIKKKQGSEGLNTNQKLTCTNNIPHDHSNMHNKIKLTGNELVTSNINRGESTNKPKACHRLSVSIERFDIATYNKSINKLNNVVGNSLDLPTAVEETIEKSEIIVELPDLAGNRVEANLEELHGITVTPNEITNVKNTGTQTLSPDKKYKQPTNKEPIPGCSNAETNETHKNKRYSPNELLEKGAQVRKKLDSVIGSKSNTVKTSTKCIQTTTDDLDEDVTETDNDEKNSERSAKLKKRCDTKVNQIESDQKQKTQKRKTHCESVKPNNKKTKNVRRSSRILEQYTISRKSGFVKVEEPTPRRIENDSTVWGGRLRRTIVPPKAYIQATFFEEPRKKRKPRQKKLAVKNVKGREKKQTSKQKVGDDDSTSDVGEISSGSSNSRQYTFAMEPSSHTIDDSEEEFQTSAANNLKQSMKNVQPVKNNNTKKSKGKEKQESITQVFSDDNGSSDTDYSEDMPSCSTNYTNNELLNTVHSSSTASANNEECGTSAINNRDLPLKDCFKKPMGRPPKKINKQSLATTGNYASSEDEDDNNSDTESTLVDSVLCEDNTPAGTNESGVSSRSSSSKANGFVGICGNKASTGRKSNIIIHSHKIIPQTKFNFAAVNERGRLFTTTSSCTDNGTAVVNNEAKVEWAVQPPVINESESYSITYCFKNLETDLFVGSSYGYLLVGPGEYRQQVPKKHSVVFKVDKGKITVHQQFVTKEMDAGYVFYVPAGSPYVIENVSASEPCVLFFHKSKPSKRSRY